MVVGRDQGAPSDLTLKVFIPTLRCARLDHGQRPVRATPLGRVPPRPRTYAGGRSAAFR